MNNCQLIGRITKEIELRTTTTGLATCSFSLAVDRGVKNANGDKQTDFINCIAWKNQAEFMSQYVKKGNLIAVQGRIQTRNYQNQQGNTIYITEVICDRVENLQSRESNQQRTQAKTQGYNPSYESASKTAESDDGLPF